MNKKVIAMAIAAAMAAPMAAQAEVKVSGRVGGELVSMDTGAGAVIGMADHGQSRVQFDYTDESGFFARYGMDVRLGRLQSEIGDPTKFRTDRDQYVGMKAFGGTLALGRITNTTANLEKDAFIGTFLELRNAAVQGGQYGSASFINQNIAFKTTVGGMKLGVDYVLSDVAAGAANGHYGVSVAGGDKDALSWYFGINNGDNVSGDQYMKAGAKMPLGGMNLWVGYDTDGTDDRINVGVTMAMAGGSLDVTFADKGADTTKSYTRIAYMAKPSKKVSWFAGYVTNGSDGGDGFGGGITVKF